MSIRIAGRDRVLFEKLLLFDYLPPRPLGLVLLLIVLAGAGQRVMAVEKPITDPEMLWQLQEHIEKVKISNPSKYKEMIARAGGNVDRCTGCHVEFIKGGGRLAPSGRAR